MESFEGEDFGVTWGFNECLNARIMVMRINVDLFILNVQNLARDSGSPGSNPRQVGFIFSLTYTYGAAVQMPARG